MILFHLQRMDARDRMRTIGGFFKGILTIIPIAFLLLSSWYFYEHADELMQKIAAAAANEAQKASESQVDKMIKQIDAFQNTTVNKLR